MEEIEFVVRIPRGIMTQINAEGINRQTIAKFIRTELKSCGGQFEPDDWRQWALKRVTVTPQVREKK